MTAGMSVMAIVWAAALVSVQVGKTVWDGVYTEAQTGRGKKAYIATCAACHQEGMQGADLAPALKGDEFLLLWNGRTVGELVDRVTQTMPQDAPGSLTAQENTDIVAYMLHVNRFPTGTAELPAEPAGQTSIVIIKK